VCVFVVVVLPIANQIICSQTNNTQSKKKNKTKIYKDSRYSLLQQLLQSQPLQIISSLHAHIRVNSFRLQNQVWKK